MKPTDIIIKDFESYVTGSGEIKNPVHLAKLCMTYVHYFLAKEDYQNFGGHLMEKKLSDSIREIYAELEFIEDYSNFINRIKTTKKHVNLHIDEGIEKIIDAFNQWDF